ncbi:hypothetical protein [Curtobacterium sp. B8]|uniref:hypothetical protein n=1 Tax=Curtobacterium sp. B8 TaxID=95611 RepID=UPI000678EBF0|nr:hypothetical protein [Curtobacterium sp. B8]
MSSSSAMTSGCRSAIARAVAVGSSLVASTFCVTTESCGVPVAAGARTPGSTATAQAAAYATESAASRHERVPIASPATGTSSTPIHGSSEPIAEPGLPSTSSTLGARRTTTPATSAAPTTAMTRERPGFRRLERRGTARG